MSDTGLILAGDVFVGPYSGLSFLGYYGTPINCTEFTLQPGDVETVDRSSRKRASYGQALDSITRPSPWTLSMTTDTMNTETLRMAFLGDTDSLSDTGASVTDEEVTAAHDLWVPLAHRNIDTGQAITVTGSGGSPSYTEDTDYVIDARNGMIRVLSTGGIADAATIEVSYTFTTLAGTKIDGAQVTDLPLRVMIDGRNLANDHRVAVIVHRANLVPASPADLMGEDFVSTQFSGTMITPTGKAGPFEFQDLGAEA